MNYSKINIFILWSDQPTERHFKDFCIPNSKDFNIEMFDIRKLLFLSSKNRRDIELESELIFKEKCDEVKTINSLTEFFSFAYNNRKNSIFLQTSRQDRYEPIFLVLSLLSCKIVYVPNSIPLPELIYLSKKSRIKRFLKFLIKDPKLIILKTIKTLLKYTRLFGRADLAIYSGSETLVQWEKIDNPKKILSYPSNHVPSFCAINNSFKHILYIEDTVFHCPEGNFSNVAYTNLEIYKHKMISFMHMLENFYNLPLIISASGKYIYKKNDFGKFPIIYRKTDRLFNESACVFTHASSAITKIFAFQTKAFTINTNSVLPWKNKESEILANYLNIPFICIDAINTSSFEEIIQNTNNLIDLQVYDKHYSWVTKYRHCLSSEIYQNAKDILFK